MNLKKTFRALTKNNDFRVQYDEATAHLKLTKNVESHLQNIDLDRPILIVCIGTDRSTGDSLGPLIGKQLSKFTHSPYTLFGTIDEPVHAVNLAQTLESIQSEFTHPFIIAIDACLGKRESVGSITIAEGPIKPGAGVKKELPEVGDIHIKGIVNVSGYMEYFVLQNTRLSLVMKMSEVIASSLHTALMNHFRKYPTKKIKINNEEHTPHPLWHAPPKVIE
ncbi:putative sporulation protein YyaC [Pullulanibacillus pueri]|uniref:Spore protease YyaC n=1 Tax=Pullulanibacillus pueri TaxID=1437324 RepID=A0A8J2ZVK4_9BACL|nr:spore protease YyaC [Pullulanibacillus pueri]MBM7682177.1 putative sporulation protein YyaC [Pullulanibacillus pueri]GGH80334.1 spore protease YyaC [Pullulanibacillus pueri]